jgi:hypothetical protein
MQRHDRRACRLPALALLALLPLLSAACGSDSTPIQPTPTTYTLTVQVRSESQQAVNGALVRITDGSNAGRNASTDPSGSAILAGLSSGSFTIEVTATGYGQKTQSVNLTTSQTTTVELKLTPNNPPQITALVVKGTSPNEPANYVDAAETATVTVSISDAETTADKMTYEWKSDVGSFTGSGPNVSWQPPGNVGGSGPTKATLSVTVVEKYGPSNSLENRVSSTVTVVLHDSKKESGDVAMLFLTEFSNSSITDPNYIVRNFSTGLCPDGKADELKDVTANRASRTITSYKLGTPNVLLNFASVCDWGARGDACVKLTCEWWDKPKTGTGAPGHVQGVCKLSTVYEQQTDAWKLCWSNFEGVSLPSGRAIRSLAF